MRAELSNSNNTILLVAENSLDKVALDAFFAAAGGKTTAAITNPSDTARSGYAVNPANVKNVQIVMS